MRKYAQLTTNEYECKDARGKLINFGIIAYHPVFGTFARIKVIFNVNAIKAKKNEEILTLTIQKIDSVEQEITLSIKPVPLPVLMMNVKLHVKQAFHDFTCESLPKMICEGYGNIKWTWIPIDNVIRYDMYEYNLLENTQDNPLQRVLFVRFDESDDTNKMLYIVDYYNTPNAYRRTQVFVCGLEHELINTARNFFNGLFNTSKRLSRKNGNYNKIPQLHDTMKKKK